MADDWRTAVSVLEERMKTMQAEYRTDIALLAKTLADDNARRDAEAARRETRLIVTLVGLVIGAVAVLGVLIRWPA